MTSSDLFLETYYALSGNKVRSALTILGIVIGIGSVIAMVGIGQGAQGSIEASIQSVGSNLILIFPGAPRGGGTVVSSGRGSAQTLTLDDATAIEQTVTPIRGVAPELSRRFQISAKGTNTNTQVTGTNTSYADVRNVQIDTGTFITDQQVRSVERVAVLGPTTRDDLFGIGADALGQMIRINNVAFRVIGVTHPKGGSGFSNSDDAVYVPISVAQQFLVGAATNYVSTISVAAQDAASLPSVQDQITTLLLDRHHMKDVASADFNVLNQADIVATASSVTGTFTMLLASIAGISLLVGGIGIMNMMLTAVTERTREIGLRKALGARNDDINRQFLAESVALTLVGGILGILLGWFLTWVVTTFASLPAQISFTSVVLACGVSALIGIVFGYYPARRAAHLNPIEALRYE